MSGSCSEVSCESQIGGQSIRPELKEWLDMVIVPALVWEWSDEPDDKRKSLINRNEDMPDSMTKKNCLEVIQ